MTVGGVLLVLVASTIAGALDSGRQDGGQSSKSSSTYPTVTTVPSYREQVALGVNVEAIWDGACRKLSDAIKAKSDRYGSLLKTGKKVQNDSYAAVDLIAAVDWWDQSEDFEAYLDVEISQIGMPGYQTALGTKALSVVPDDYIEDMIAHCGQAGHLKEVRDQAALLARTRTAVQQAAQMVPWYPKGYTDYSSTIAWRWLERGEYRCSYGDYCWGVYIISLESCSSLYAEITILDDAESNIGFANDLASGVAGGERVKLVFETFTPGANTARLTSIDCL